MGRVANTSKRLGLKPVLGLLASVALATTAATTAQASIIGVSGPNSTAGAAAAIIAAPAAVQNGNVLNLGQQGFDEMQGVTTSVMHATDSGSIAIGTTVDSHMIFLNRSGNSRIDHNNVVWTFSGAILGVMSDYRGNLEAASTFELGSPFTTYPASGFRARGMENDDTYSILGNMLTVNMAVTEPGDWIRVVTASTSAVPEPASLGILAMGLGLLGLRRKAQR